jgi:hypothetical protein
MRGGHCGFQLAEIVYYWLMLVSAKPSQQPFQRRMQVEVRVAPMSSLVINLAGCFQLLAIHETDTAIRIAQIPDGVLVLDGLAVPVDLLLF